MEILDSSIMHVFSYVRVLHAARRIAGWLVLLAGTIMIFSWKSGDAFALMYCFSRVNTFQTSSILRVVCFSAGRQHAMNQVFVTW